MGLSVPNCELFGGRSETKEPGLLCFKGLFEVPRLNWWRHSKSPQLLEKLLSYLTIVRSEWGRQHASMVRAPNLIRRCK